MRKLIDTMEQARHATLDQGRPEAVARQHKHGKLTARERIAQLCDTGSFRESGGLVKPLEDNPFNQNLAAPADALVTGTGLIDGAPVMEAANDYTVLGGSIGTVGMEKLMRAARRAGDAGMPLILLQ